MHISYIDSMIEAAHEVQLYYLVVSKLFLYYFTDAGMFFISSPESSVLQW